MSGSSTKVRVTGFCEAYPWMAGLVGEVGRAVERRENERSVAVLVEGLPCGPTWIGAGHLEEVEPEEESAA